MGTTMSGEPNRRALRRLLRHGWSLQAAASAYRLRPSEALAILDNRPEPPDKRRQLYPWHHWFDGTPHILRQGQDFHCPVQDFRCRVNHAARERRHLIDMDTAYGGLLSLVCLTGPKYARPDIVAAVFGDAPRG